MNISERYFVMILLSVFNFMYFFQNGSPGALQDDLMKFFQLTSGQYAALYAVSSWSALFDILNGYIIERWLGLKLATYIYLLIILVGNIIYIAAAYLEIYWLLVLGRFLFGLGINPLCLCMSVYIIHWFNGKELNLMFSIMVSVIWLGSTAVNYSSVRLLEYIRSFQDITANMGLSITVCTLTVFSTAITLFSSGTVAFLYKDKGKHEQTDTKNCEVKKEKKSVKQMLNFKPIFWLYSLASFLNFTCTASFLAMSQDFFITQYNISVIDSSLLISIYSLLTFVFSPPLGYITDIVGRNLIFFISGVIFALLAHLAFSYAYINAYVGLVLLSISGAFSSCRWAVLKYLVKDYQYTIAYGIAQTGAQFSLAFGSLAAGYLCDSFGYSSLPYFYSGLSIVSLGLLIIIYFLDIATGRILTMSETERKSRETSKPTKSPEKEENGNLETTEEILESTKL